MPAVGTVDVQYNLYTDELNIACCASMLLVVASLTRAAPTPAPLLGARGYQISPATGLDGSA